MHFLVMSTCSHDLHSANTYRLQYIQDRVFFLVILSYEIIQNLNSYLSYCFNSALYIYVYLDVFNNGDMMLMACAYDNKFIMKTSYFIVEDMLMIVKVSVTVDVTLLKLNRQRYWQKVVKSTQT